MVSGQSGQHPEHGRLAGAAATDQRHDLTAADPQRDVVEHAVAPVPFGHRSQFSRSRGGVLGQFGDLEDRCHD
ncbi:Uncharacterised protein [Mycobacteroides abscessus subsp. massiliense]|nr:Uncharacterised protein [Mycobacteroides abscessus subsp. massiliense]